jgi:hypothetical protein
MQVSIAFNIIIRKNIIPHEWVWSRTTDAQRGNSLHCKAENSIPIPNFRYGRRIFCLPYRPNFSDIFDLCLYWVSVVCGSDNCERHGKTKLHNYDNYQKTAWWLTDKYVLDDCLKNAKQMLVNWLRNAREMPDKFKKCQIICLYD